MEAREERLVDSEVSHSVSQPLVEPATSLRWASISVGGEEEDTDCWSGGLEERDEKAGRRRGRRMEEVPVSANLMSKGILRVTLRQVTHRAGHTHRLHLPSQLLCKCLVNTNW